MTQLIGAEAANVLDCGHAPSPHSDCTTGYGEDDKGKRYCYACCANRDRAAMVKDGRATLYLTHKNGVYTVSNWPSSLVFSVHHVKNGRHNIAGTRYDVWFTGPDGRNWHGVQYGEQTQLVHCRATTGKE